MAGAAPDPAAALCDRAALLIDVGRATDALGLLEQAHAADPGRTETACLRAHALLLLGRHAESLAVAEQAIHLDPEQEAGHRLRSMALQRGNRHREALAAALEAARLAPTSSLVLHNLARAQINRGRIEDAVQTSARLIELAPSWGGSFELAALLAARRERWSEAEGQWRQALALSPEDASYHNNLGVALLKQKKLQEAIELFLGAARLRPSLEVFRANLETALRHYAGAPIGMAAIASMFAAGVAHGLLSGQLAAYLALQRWPIPTVLAWLLGAAGAGAVVWSLAVAWRRRRALAPTLAELVKRDEADDRERLLAGSAVTLTAWLTLAALLSFALAANLADHTPLGWLVMLFPVWLGVKGVRAYRRVRARDRAKRRPWRVRILGGNRRGFYGRVTYFTLLHVCLAGRLSMEAPSAWPLLILPVIVIPLMVFGRRRLGLDEP